MPKITFKNKIKQILDILYYGKDDFYEDLERLNSIYSQKDINLEDPESRDIYSLIRDINWFLKKHKLSKLYFNPILSFILHRDFRIDTSIGEYPVDFINGTPRGSDDRSFYLEIYPETTRKDIISAWNYVKREIIKNSKVIIPRKQKLKSKKMLMIKYMTIEERLANDENRKITDKDILSKLNKALPEESKNLSYYDIPKLRLLRKKMLSKLS